MSVRVVVISGAIGVGKTTLINLFSENQEGHRRVFLHEPVKEWEEKGWLGKFYGNRAKFALSFQLGVYVSRIAQLEQHIRRSNCCDEDAVRTIFVERYIYDQLLFWQRQQDLVDPMENEIYMDIWHLWRRFVPEPSGYILLTTDDPELACKRIEERGREDELKVSRDGDFIAYQKALREDHLRFFAEGRAHPPHCTVKEGIPCLHVNTSNLPFHKSEESKQQVISKIQDFLKENKL